MFSDKKTKSVADAVAKIMSEELKGKQHKIDVAEPKGKLTGADFKKLRTMKKEEAEQIDELSSNTLKSYAKKAVYDMQASQNKSKVEYDKAAAAKDDKDAEKHYNAAMQAKDRTEKRMAGVAGAIKRLNKEGVAEGSLNVEKKLAGLQGEEVENLDEVKLADLPKRTVKGKSYGADYEDPEGRDDADDKPAEPAKRGRGRPKGTFKRRFNTKLYKESFTEMMQNLDQRGLEFVSEMLVVEEPTNDEYTAEVKDAQEKSEGKGKKAEVAKPAVQAVKNEEVEQIDEIELTESTVVGKLKQGVSKINMHGLPFEIPKHTTNHVMNGKKYKVVSHTHDDGYSHQIFHGSGEQAKGLSPDVKKTLLRDHRKARNASFDEEVEQEVEQIDERHLTSAETKKKEEVVKSMKKKLSGFRERYGKRAKEVMYATATKVAKGSK